MFPGGTRKPQVQPTDDPWWQPLDELARTEIHCLPSDVPIGHHPPSVSDPAQIMSREDEQEAFSQMNACRQEARRWQQKLRVELSQSTSSHETTELARDIGQQMWDLLDRAAAWQQHLAIVFRKLCIACVRRLVRSDQEQDEWLAESDVTLVRAIDCFDVSRGFRFSTYLTNALNHNLWRHHQRENRRKEVTSGLEADRLVDERKWDSGAIRRVESALAAVKQAMEELCERDRYILCERFGLGEHDGKTLKELAEELNVSRERVRQLEVRALQRLAKIARDQNAEIDF